MSDPLKPVNPGDGPGALFRADTFNLHQEVARWYRDHKGGHTGAPVLNLGRITSKLIIWVRAPEGTHGLDAWSVVTPTGVAIDPETVPLKANDNPVFDVSEPQPDQPFFVTVEPIAPGKLGRAVASGVVPVRVDVTDPAHQWARPVPGDPTQLRSSAANGPARILSRPGVGSFRCLVLLGEGMGTVVDAVQITEAADTTGLQRGRVLDYENGSFVLGREVEFFELNGGEVPVGVRLNALLVDGEREVEAGSEGTRTELPLYVGTCPSTCTSTTTEGPPGTTTTTTTFGPCTGRCEWTWNAADQVWELASSTCCGGGATSTTTTGGEGTTTTGGEGPTTTTGGPGGDCHCKCTAPNFCPPIADYPACVSTVCRQAQTDQAPPNCSGTTTTFGPPPECYSTTTTTASCMGGACSYYCHPVNGWVTTSNTCGPPCGGCAGPSVACTSANWCTTETTYCNPPPPPPPPRTCNGYCIWVWAPGPGNGWVYVPSRSVPCFETNGAPVPCACGCDRPEVPEEEPLCGAETRTDCYYHCPPTTTTTRGPCDPPPPDGTTTTPGPGSCAGECLFYAYGEGWAKVSGCISCGCAAPLHPPTTPCEYVTTPCSGTTTTTTPGPTTTTTTVGWGCYVDAAVGCDAPASYRNCLQLPVGDSDPDLVRCAGPFGDSEACTTGCNPTTTTTTTTAGCDHRCLGNTTWCCNGSNCQVNTDCVDESWTGPYADFSACQAACAGSTTTTTAGGTCNQCFCYGQLLSRTFDEPDGVCRFEWGNIYCAQSSPNGEPAGGGLYPCAAGSCGACPEQICWDFYCVSSNEVGSWAILRNGSCDTGPGSEEVDCAATTTAGPTTTTGGGTPTTGGPSPTTTAGGGSPTTTTAGMTSTTAGGGGGSTTTAGSFSTSGPGGGCGQCEWNCTGTYWQAISLACTPGSGCNCIQPTTPCTGMNAGTQVLTDCGP